VVPPATRPALRGAGHHDMRKSLRLIFATVVVAASSVAFSVATPGEVALAEDNCGKVIPANALDGSTWQSAYNGVQQALSTFLPNAPNESALAFGAGGAGLATLAQTTVVAGKVTLATAALFSVYSGTCRFLDMITGDSAAAYSEPLITETSLTRGSRIRCDTPGIWSGAPPTYTSTTYPEARCQDLVLTSGSVPAGDYYHPNCVTWNGPGGVGTTPQMQEWPGSYLSRSALCTGNSMYGTAVALAPATLPTSGQFLAGEGATHGQHTTLRLIWPCVHTIQGVATVNVGGQCGIPPNGVMIGSNYQQGSVPHVIVNFDPNVRTVGWSRYWSAHIQCRASGVNTWYKTDSATWSDPNPNVRMEMPVCPAGSVPLNIRIWKVPQNVQCVAGAATCFHSGALAHSWVAPSSWSTTAPNWTVCLSATDCGTPQLSNGSCLWGGFVVPGSFCGGPATDAATRTALPGLAPKTEPTSPLATPINLAAPVDQTKTATSGSGGGGGGGTTVTVAIDDDGETSRRADLGALPENAECWPDGWGWGSCCTYERWVYAGAAWCIGPDGQRYMHLFVR